jgi:adenine-specific DNA methylase
MDRANAQFWNALPQDSKSRRRGVTDVRCGDARKLPWEDGSVDLVVTSPPYVTSYAYADLHELTSLWLGAVSALASPKSQFVGSAAARNRSDAQAQSGLGRSIVAALREKSPARAEDVRQYFLDIEDAFREMRRVLARGGTLCDVIGNTSLKGVEVLNAEVHGEILAHLGFEVAEVIRRVIPLKTLPQVRDPKSGKFTSAPRSEAVEAYPEEFILIGRKR